MSRESKQRVRETRRMADEIIDGMGAEQMRRALKRMARRMNPDTAISILLDEGIGAGQSETICDEVQCIIRGVLSSLAEEYGEDDARDGDDAYPLCSDILMLTDGDLLYCDILEALERRYLPDIEGMLAKYRFDDAASLVLTIVSGIEAVDAYDGTVKDACGMASSTMIGALRAGNIGKVFDV